MINEGSIGGRMKPFGNDFSSIANQEEVVYRAVLALAKLIYKGCDGFLMEASVFWSTRLPRCIGLRRAVWVWRRIDGS